MKFLHHKEMLIYDRIVSITFLSTYKRIAFLFFNSFLFTPNSICQCFENTDDVRIIHLSETARERDLSDETEPFRNECLPSV